MDLLSMPVTIVVKAPNQKIADQTIECGLEWTIRKVKQHLENVYPSKPSHNEQRLIYSGKLLNDQMVLKDVLRQDTEMLAHTVHLVCSPSVSEPSTFDTTSVPSPNIQASSHNTVPVRSMPPGPMAAESPDGLRHRNAPNFSQHQQPFPHGPQDIYNNYYSTMYQHSYTQEQWLYLQQMYAHQMHQYMQYYNQHAAGTTGQVAPEVLQPGGNAPANDQNANQQNQNIRMNAQGGQDVDDEDDERNRDWLDWLYTFIRFGVLLSIMYFYSTLSRFLMVFTLCLIMYLYTSGWFRLARREPAPRDNAQQQPPQQQQQQQQQQMDDENNENNPENQDNETDGDQPEDPVQEEPPSPGVIKIAISFFVTFFSSLIPHQPDAVNAN